MSDQDVAVLIGLHGQCNEKVSHAEEEGHHAPEEQGVEGRQRIPLYLNGDSEWLKPTVLASVAAAIYLTETLIFIFAKRRTATVLQSPRQFFCLPLFRFAKPFINGLLNWHSQQGDNYTWE